MNFVLQVSVDSKPLETVRVTRCHFGFEDPSSLKKSYNKLIDFIRLLWIQNPRNWNIRCTSDSSEWSTWDGKKWSPTDFTYIYRKIQLKYLEIIQKSIKSLPSDDLENLKKNMPSEFLIKELLKRVSDLVTSENLTEGNTYESVPVNIS